MKVMAQAQVVGRHVNRKVILATPTTPGAAAL